MSAACIWRGPVERGIPPPLLPLPQRLKTMQRRLSHWAFFLNGAYSLNTYAACFLHKENLLLVNCSILQYEEPHHKTRISRQQDYT